MSTDIATNAQTAVAVVRDQLAKMGAEFKAALPAHIPVERFSRVAMTAINRNPDLLHADRKSLFEACMLAAQDGLLPDGREAALVIYNTKKRGASGDIWVKSVQYMPMVAGIRKKVYQSGEITSLVARTVYADDDFEVCYGDDEHITHRPNLQSQGEMIAVYAIATYRDGSKARDVMSINEINRIRALSRSPEKGPWKDHYGEMAKKTIIRRLSKNLPLSTDVEETLRRDDYLYERDEESVAQVRDRPRNIAAVLDNFAVEGDTDEAGASPVDLVDDCPPAADLALSTAAQASTPLPRDVDAAPSSDNPIAIAYERGRQTAIAGAPRKLPKDAGYHYRSQAAEAEAFFEGYDDTAKKLADDERRRKGEEYD